MDIFLVVLIFMFLLMCILFYLFASAKKKLSEYRTAVWILTGRLKRHRKSSEKVVGGDVVVNYIKDIFEIMLAYIPESEQEELRTLFYAEK